MLLLNCAASYLGGCPSEKQNPEKRLFSGVSVFTVDKDSDCSCSTYPLLTQFLHHPNIRLQTVWQRRFTPDRNTRNIPHMPDSTSHFMEPERYW